MSRLGNPYSCIAQHRLQVLRNLAYLGWATPPPTLGNTAADIGQHRRRPCPTGEPKSPCTPSRYWAIGIVEVGRVDKQKVLLTNDSKELFDFLGF